MKACRWSVFGQTLSFRCQLPRLSHLAQADQSLAGDRADRGQPPHQHLQVRPPALSGLFGNCWMNIINHSTSRDETRMTQIYFWQKPWISSLSPSLWHVSFLPHQWRQMRARISRAGWIIIALFHQKPNELWNYLVGFLDKRCLRWCMTLPPWHFACLNIAQKSEFLCVAQREPG